mmetsp:Transcript_23195/g.55001  ORF Transcript_23195/g.55001 Transcript_23195/m.55001 type:complete len:165 (+) Transcript_23195:196-690(+)
MARSRRGGGMGAARRPAPPARRQAPPSRPASTQATPAPRPSSTPAPMQQSSGGGGMLSGIGSTIAQGMAFGTGSAIAHRAVGAVAGSMSGGGGDEAPVETGAAPPADYNNGYAAQSQQVQGACANDKQMFYECLQVNRGDQEACKFLYQQLQECQQSATTMSFQ